MKNYLIIVLMTLPVWLEIIFDKWRWSQGKDDKPISTWLRGILMVFMAATLHALDIGHMFQSLVLLVATHLVLFNPSLNKARGLDFFYRKEGEIWTYLPIPVEWGIKLLIYYSAWAIFFHWDWVQGNYPDRLIEFFMF